MASKTGRIVNFALKNQNIFSIRLPKGETKLSLTLFGEFSFWSGGYKRSKMD